MDDYRLIEIETAKKHGATTKGTKKSIGDFLLKDNIQKPVNVKSNTHQILSLQRDSLNGLNKMEISCFLFS